MRCVANPCCVQEVDWTVSGAQGDLDPRPQRRMVAHRPPSLAKLSSVANMPRLERVSLRQRVEGWGSSRVRVRIV